MARKAEPGINYYQIKVNHVTNSKIRLLFNEFNSDGYWIWSCLIDKIYAEKGYYFDMSNREDLELFATDVCKKRVSLVKEVIEGCVRRGLFDKSVFDSFQFLTSDRIQANYIEATKERRRKGGVITIIKELLVIDLEPTDKNIQVAWGDDVFPGRFPILPRNNSQKKREEKKEDTPGGKPPVVPEPEIDLKAMYSEMEKDAWSIHHFLVDYKPDFIEPYVDYWNAFAKKRGLAQVETITDARVKKFKIRLAEKTFDFTKILKRAKNSDFLLSGKFFSFDWIFSNETNYIKVLEGNYDNKGDSKPPKVNGNAPASTAPPLATLPSTPLTH